MTKIKVNIDKPDPPPQVIRKHKNFNNFMQTYQKLHTQKGIREMWYRDKKTLAWIAILIVLLLLLVLFEEKKKDKKNRLPDKQRIEQQEKK